MSSASDIVNTIAASTDWNARVAAIRTIPEQFGTGQHAEVYAAVAERVYVPSLKADFAYVHWRDEYELAAIEAPFEIAMQATSAFTRVDRTTLSRTIADDPKTLRIFRLLLGLTGQEFAEACSIVAEDLELNKVSKSSIDAMENRGRIREGAADTCAAVVDLLMSGEIFPPLSEESELRRKLDKPDTRDGWKSVQQYAEQGVPLAVLLHQRAYGGAFRQLLDATSTMRGDLLEDPVEKLFRKAGIPHIRTGSSDQDAAATRFGLTVRPAPDFIVFDNRTRTLRAILECKGANDGGTARDKASRFRSLRDEAKRLGGVPVFAVLGGVGWKRTADALGPVVRDTDGRVFTLSNLKDMLDTEPFPGLQHTAPSSQ